MLKPEGYRAVDTASATRRRRGMGGLLAVLHTPLTTNPVPGETRKNSGGMTGREWMIKYLKSSSVSHTVDCEIDCEKRGGRMDRKEISNLNMMSLLLASLFVLGSSCAYRVCHDMTSLETLLKNATSVVFYTSRMIDDDITSYEFSSTEVITDTQLVSEWRQVLTGAQPADQSSYPFIGGFTSFLFLDQDQKPIAFVSILNWKCRGVVIPISHYRSKKNGFILDERKNKHRGFGWQSEPFVRNVYNYMELNRTDELQKKRDFFSETTKGRLSLEKLLFEGDDSEE